RGASPAPAAAVAAPTDTALAAATRRFEELAFGVTAPAERAPPGFASPEAAVAAMPLWNTSRVMAAAAQHRELLGPGAKPAAAGLAVHSLAGGRATWVVAPAPDVDAISHTQASPGWTILHRGIWAGGGRPLRYLRAALVGTVSAANGDTHLYLAPGADSLAAAWAAVLAPLIQPLDSLPAALRSQLPFPDRVFRAATTLVRRWRADTTTWTARPRDPFELVAPAAEGRGEAAALRALLALGAGPPGAADTTLAAR